LARPIWYCSFSYGVLQGCGTNRIVISSKSRFSAHVLLGSPLRQTINTLAKSHYFFLVLQPYQWNHQSRSFNNGGSNNS
jgi:hypothetical protein